MKYQEELEKLLFVPLVGTTSACRQKEGLKLIKYLPRLTAVLPPQGREMTTYGFTLIELLVVVLIIGILAALALPQYQLAMDKARWAPYLNLARSITQAEQHYFLEHGNYTIASNDLDITFEKICPNQAWNRSQLVNCNGGFHLDITGEGRGFRITYCGSNPCPISAWRERTYINSLVFSSSANTFKPTCVFPTTRGKRLCNYFNSMKSENL